MAVDRVGADEVRPRSAAATHSLVVAEIGAAEQHVVHRPLAAGGQSQRFQQGVDQALAGLHVPPHHGRSASRSGAEVRVQDTAGGNLQPDRRHESFVERQVRFHQQPQHVDHCAAHDRRRSVQIAGMDRRRSGKIDLCPLSSYSDFYLQQRSVIQLLCRLVEAVRQSRQSRADALFRLLFERSHVVQHGLVPVLLGQFLQRPHPAVVGRQRRVQVGDVFFDAPGRIWPFSQYRANRLPVHLSTPRQVGRRDHHSLLLQAGGHRRHRPRAHSSDLGVVRAAGHVADALAAE